MEQYISKSAIMAEIERTQKILNLDDYGGRSVMAWSEGLKNFLDTLEIKEVDLETLEAWLQGFIGFYAHENSGEYPSALEIAEHFFELGLKTQKEE